MTDPEIAQGRPLQYDGLVKAKLAWPLAVVCLVLVTFGAIAGQSSPPPRRTRAVAQLPSQLGTSRQAVLVVTGDWTATAGTLQRFERNSGAAPWRAVSPIVRVVVGRNGLAWGRGGGANQAGGPAKQEGDGKAPAGVFRLGAAFGQSRNAPEKVTLPYLYLSNDVECVDDVRSSHYNRLVTKQQAGRVDWTSSEKMWQEPLYKRGVVVEYNTGQPLSSAGSCIFLHIWKGPESVTAGCTAMPELDLADLITWLDAGKVPVLVQLPRDQYRRLKTRWNLP